MRSRTPKPCHNSRAGFRHRLGPIFRQRPKESAGATHCGPTRPSLHPCSNCRCRTRLRRISTSSDYELCGHMGCSLSRRFFRIVGWRGVAPRPLFRSDVFWWGVTVVWSAVVACLARIYGVS
ncbi:hypothetical protein K438DRAFT_224734 [Mycena galopus ATCC 62051]|nr:hypothetical protein K438DRAFT_224734 [Mycena galopus ATCC 62051]